MFEENSLTVLLASFFYTHRHLHIAGLGSLELKEGSSPLPDEHGNQAFPEGSIAFTYYPAEKSDPELIDFITERSRKMKALATSDVASIADAARELLNIGQSYTFTGIVKLMPLGNCKFRVVPTMVFPNLLESNAGSATHSGPLKKIPKTPLPRPVEEASVHSQVRVRSPGGLLILGTGLVVMALLVYFLFFTGHAASPDQVPSQTYTSAAPDAPAPLGSMENNGVLHYEVIFEKAGRSRALQRYRQLTAWGHDVILHTRDSVRYTLAVPVATMAADTEAVKDSIRALYGHPVYIRYPEQ